MSLDKEVDKPTFPSSGRPGGPGGVPTARSGNPLGGFCGLGRMGGQAILIPRAGGGSSVCSVLAWSGLSLPAPCPPNPSVWDPLGPPSEVYVLGVHLSQGAPLRDTEEITQPSPRGFSDGPEGECRRVYTGGFLKRKLPGGT